VSVAAGWVLARNAGGEGGIRTPDTLSGMSAFEADRFNRSRTSPCQGNLHAARMALV
jgi:hypothetical protein